MWPPSSQRLQANPNDPLEIRSDLGFPESEDGPAHLLEATGVLPVALDIALDLGEPVIGVGAAAQLPSPALPVSAVPEVPVAEDGDPRSVENDVGPPRQCGDVLPVPAPGRPESPSENDLTSRIRLLAAPPSRCSGSGGGWKKALVARALRGGELRPGGCFGRRGAHEGILPENAGSEESLLQFLAPLRDRATAYRGALFESRWSNSGASTRASTGGTGDCQGFSLGL
jgi:hypothetical protein